MPQSTTEQPTEKKRILLIGGGPSRGDGESEDAAATEAVRALRENGHHVIVITSNPDTSLSDPTLADRTYLEPLDDLAVRAILDHEKPDLVVATFGGAHGLALASALEASGALGALGAALVSFESLAVVASGAPRAAPAPAADAGQPVLILGPGPARVGEGSELATCAREAIAAVREAGHEPIFVDATAGPLTAEAVAALFETERAAGVIVQLGGEQALALTAALALRGVPIFGTKADGLARAVLRAQVAVDPTASHAGATSLDDAVAVSVDAVSDGKRVVIAGSMEHLEPPFVHGGDAAAIIPAFTLDAETVARVEDRVRALALDLGIVGLLSARLAVSGKDIILLDITPRAGLTTAFVTRATGFPLVRVATKVMLGHSLDEQGISERPIPRHVAARERVFPQETAGGDTVLGAAMRSTGGAIGLDDSPARAYRKALRGIGISAQRLEAPSVGQAGANQAPRCIAFSVTERDLPSAVELARRLRALGFDIVATSETAIAIGKARIPVTMTMSEAETGDEFEALATRIRAGGVDFAITTARGGGEIASTRPIRSACQAAHVPCFTTMRLAKLGCAALEETPAARVRTVQDWYAADV